MTMDSKIAAGVSTDVLTLVVSWVSLPYHDKTVLITNLSDKNSIRYVVSGLVTAKSSVRCPLWPECSLKPGDSQPLHITHCWEVITVEVVSEVPGLPADFVIEYCGGG